MGDDTENDTKKALLNAAVSKVATTLSADVVIFNSDVGDGSASELHTALESIAKPKKSIFFVLVTFGGDPHAAYRIARELQLRYERVILCIAGDCYSAGTLVVLSAHEVVIADRGNLGPIDVQILKKDELREYISGLAVQMSLNELNKAASKAAIEIVDALKHRYGRSLSFKTALDLGANITSHTFGEIYRQIDPIRIGEDGRLLKIASHYGFLLGGKSRNLKPDAIRRLLEDYPSHECIIDREEAGELFNSVRRPSESELVLLEQLSDFATDARQGPFIASLEEKETSDGPKSHKSAVESQDNNGKEKTGPGSAAPIVGDEGKSAQARGATRSVEAPKT